MFAGGSVGEKIIIQTLVIFLVCRGKGWCLERIQNNNQITSTTHSGHLQTPKFVNAHGTLNLSDNPVLVQTPK